MPGKPIRTKNRFGSRFIKPDELWGYAEDLGLKLPAGRDSFLEYLEREGILSPVRRVSYPAPTVRRLAKEERDRHPSEEILEPVEEDDTIVKPAAELHSELCFSSWRSPHIYGEREHILDALHPEHAAFVQTAFDPSTFKPWEDFKIFAYLMDGQEIYAGDRFYPVYYHGWQVFRLATFLRSSATLYYPVNDEEMARAIWDWTVTDENVRSRLQVTCNLEARHELNEITSFADHFDAVAYYQAYAHNAFQIHGRHADDHGRLAGQHWRNYRKRKTEIAKTALARFEVSDDDLIGFLKAQTRWWSDAERGGPHLLAEEWKRQIGATLDCHQAATGASHASLVEKVGRTTSHFKPALEVIFPSWINEQRDLAVRSLKRWAEESLSGLTAPFSLDEGDVEAFCDWIEHKELFQYYWHYRRLVDSGGRDDPVQRSATAAEAASFASLVEMIVNEILVDRGTPPRGPRMNLNTKLRRLYGPAASTDFTPWFDRHAALMRTEQQSLRQRLSQIARLKRSGGVHAAVLRLFLGLVAIRNEGVHLGLQRFDRVEATELIRIMSLAALLIWRGCR